MTHDVYLIGAARTAIGSFGGAFAGTPATQLGSAVIRAALLRAPIEPGDVDEVIMGNVLSAGLGQNPARQASIGAGVPAQVPAATISKVCGSGLKAVMFAAQAIRCGDANVIVAGGMENMSRAPYLLDKARAGYRMGNGQIIDSMIHDGLWDAYGNIGMGTLGDACAGKYAITRQEQDDFAVASYRRAIAAEKAGVFAREIVPIDTASGKRTVTISQDQGPTKFDEDKMRQLRPAFDPAGTVTAANASSINDGAAAVVAVSGEFLKTKGLRAQAKVLGYASSSREPEWFTLAPIGAITSLLKKLNLKVADIDLFEINEAFSCVPMAAMKELGIPHDKVNIHGGAVALGHPIGASGARTLVTLIHALHERKVKIGITALCIGGGEAVAIAVECC